MAPIIPGSFAFADSEENANRQLGNRSNDLLIKAWKEPQSSCDRPECHIH